MWDMGIPRRKPPKREKTMGTKSKVTERSTYYYSKLIDNIVEHIPNMTEQQLERLEMYAKAELWDRQNQPSGQIFEK